MLNGSSRYELKWSYVIKYCEAWQGSNAIVKPYAYAMIILTLYSWIFDLFRKFTLK